MAIIPGLNAHIISMNSANGQLYVAFNRLSIVDYLFDLKLKKLK